MRTDRLLHLGVGLLALSLLLALGLSGASVRPDDRAALAMVSWLESLTLVLGAGFLVGHVVVRALAPPTIEEQIADWYE